ncbi:MAG: hypothetical protein M1819_002258 [Sarea resinae]|nr:MAG: hypothetical protein M1819_002258 [Sarea resinae]
MNTSRGRRICALVWESASPLLYGAARRRTFTPIPKSPTSPFSTWNSIFRPNPPPFFSNISKTPKHVLSRSFASGGFFAFTVSPTSSAADAAITACAATVEHGSYAVVKRLERKRLLGVAQLASRNGFHTNVHGKPFRAARRNKSSASRNPESNKASSGKPEEAAGSERRKVHDKAVVGGATTSNSRHILNNLPHPRIPQIHRPTKEELLAAATGFWSRLKVRFKWFSIRSVRPFNMDDISAFFSWIILGHVIWIILGTTTFFSLVIFLVNTVFAQETLARGVGNYLTKSSGVKVVFESAIVPKWGDGVISFKNVFLSRRPGQGKTKVSKGSPTTAAAAAAAAERGRGGDAHEVTSHHVDEEEDTNYTQFDLSVDTINVTLSFNKWFNGKGLLRDVEVKGVRGVIDRRSVESPEEYVDPRSYKHVHEPGDFEMDSFKLEDLLVTLYQPGDFRPFSISVYSCDLPQLRKQWLFYDFLSANMVSGSFDESLFTIHPRQVHGHTGVQLNNGVEVSDEASPWKKQSRLRIDGLSIDHLNRGVEGPFSWIHEGNVDIVADVMFPVDNDESIAKVMSDFYQSMEATVTSNRYLQLNRSHEAREGEVVEHPSPDPEPKDPSDDDKRFLVMDLRIHLNDVRAGVPLFTNDLSYVNNALIRPIVAYINSRKTFIPINCRVVKRASEFDGSWTVFDSGLLDDLSAETYEAFARNVVDEQARMRRLKKVGLWSLQLAVQALFLGMAGNIA